MSNPTDNAFERLKNLMPTIQAALKEHPNESDTRFKALDRILLEVLHWSHDAVLTEPHTNAGYIDYLLTVGEKRNAMVIEAKKVGVLTTGVKSDNMMKVSLSGAVVKPMLHCLRQALGYATEKGVAVASITDGETWLFFKA